MTLTTAIKIALLATGVILPTLLIIVVPSKRKEIALVFASLVFSAGLAEAILRTFYPQVQQHNEMFEFDPTLGWRFIPNKRGSIVYPGEVHHYIKTNSMGFRDDSSTVSEGNSRKVMVLGDSFVSNISVGSRDVFTEIMERRMYDTSVMNFGVNGYGQVQEYLLLEQWFDRLHPDLIILVIYVRNDFQDNLANPWLYDRPVAVWDEAGEKLDFLPPSRDSSSPVGPPFWRIYRRSHLYTLLSRDLEIIVSRWSPSEPKPSPFTPPEIYLCRKKASKETGRMYRVMKALLLKFSSYANDRGVPIVFAVAPSLVQIDEKRWFSTLGAYGVDPQDYKQSLPEDVLMEFAAENDLLMLDLLPILREESEAGDPLYNPREKHWTVRGNEVVARAMLEFLEKNELVDHIMR